jgi:hypothetical protein
MGRQLVILGLLIAAAGAVMSLGLPLGRLPGDFTIRRGSFSFYFPLTTSIFVSLVFTVVAWLVGKR